MGDYLAPPHWKIRFVRFTGDVAERAEEYQVFLAGAQGVYRFRHVLPEAAPGESLAEEGARTLAHDALRERHNLDPAALKEISAESSKLKARTDWDFTYSDPAGIDLSPGEKRISIHVAGDRVSDAFRYVHEPEDWQRADRDRQVLPSIINLSCIAVLAVLVLAGAVWAVVAWSRKQFAVSAFLWVLGAVLAIRIIDVVNSMPSLIAQFSTAQPYKVQLFTFILAGLLATVVMAGSMGLVAGLVRRKIDGAAAAPGAAGLTGESPGSRLFDLPSAARVVIPGISLGCAAAGLAALGSSLGPSVSPAWADYAPQGTFAPAVQIMLGSLDRTIVHVLVLLLVFVALDRFTERWTRRRVPFAVLLFLVGFAVAGSGQVQTIGGWMAEGIAAGMLLLISYWVVLRFSYTMAVFAAGTFGILAALKEGFSAAFPAALPGALAGSVLVAAAALCLSRLTVAKGNSRDS